MRRPLIAGNWKMHKTLPEARELVVGIRAGLETEGTKARRHAGTQGKPDEGVQVLICPPFTLLFPMAKALAGSDILLGAQNAHYEPQGAYTGEVSVAMLAETGCTHVIVGHSERRHIFKEDSALLARKVRAVLDAGLHAIYCIGETLEERESGKTQAVVRRQLEEVLTRDLAVERLIAAYEPVWAIGTGRNATPEQAQEVHAFIRQNLSATYGSPSADSIRILYGGSVKPSNAKELLSQADVDGALVGGACLAAADFLAIISAAASVCRTESR